MSGDKGWEGGQKIRKLGQLRLWMVPKETYMIGDLIFIKNSLNPKTPYCDILNSGS